MAVAFPSLIQVERRQTNTIVMIFNSLSICCECSGQVTTWRLSTTPTVNIPILPQTARIDLQIWGIDDRGCYTLKQQVRLSDSDSVRNEKKEWVLSEPQYQLHFSEGDFIGFYVHSNIYNGLGCMIHAHVQLMLHFVTIPTSSIFVETFYCSLYITHTVHTRICIFLICTVHALRICPYMVTITYTYVHIYV